MARKTVKEFKVTMEEKCVNVEIHTENNKPYHYSLFTDTRHPDLNAIKEHFEQGLEEAKSKCKKIEVSDYSERSYVFITLPIESHSNQYTAKKL